MSIPRNAVRAFSRAALVSTRASTVSSSWALRSASLSTSSGGEIARPWAQKRPPKAAAQTPERSDGPSTEQYHLAVHITGLDSTVTLTDLVQGIAETAPVGMILSARLLPAAAPPREDDNTFSPPSPSPQFPFQKADIIFGNENAPYELRRHAQAKTFLVRGKPAFVAINTQLSFRGPKAERRRSRALRIRGPPGADGFDEATMRGVLAASASAMEAAGARGLDSEPVEMREEDDGAGGTVRVMEWRFFDTKQARSFLGVLRAHYGRALDIQSAPDPCWDYREMLRYLNKLDRPRDQGKGVRRLARQPAWSAPVVDPATPVYPAYFLEPAAETEESTSIEKERPRQTGTDRE